MNQQSTSRTYLDHTAIATWFYIGEPADASNGFIANAESAWDSNWQVHYGGIDNPTQRAGYLPARFVPKENPFYCALPAADYEGDTLGAVESIGRAPWFVPPASEQSIFKNRWIKVTHGQATAYCQWEDVGPNLTNDFDYVFGTLPPRNKFGEHAGIDISPAMRDYLQTGDSAQVTWQFADAPSPGPWTHTITTSPRST